MSTKITLSEAQRQAHNIPAPVWAQAVALARHHHRNWVGLDTRPAQTNWQPLEGHQYTAFRPGQPGAWVEVGTMEMVTNDTIGATGVSYDFRLRGAIKPDTWVLERDNGYGGFRVYLTHYVADALPARP